MLLLSAKLLLLYIWLRLHFDVSVLLQAGILLLLPNKFLLLHRTWILLLPDFWVWLLHGILLLLSASKLLLLHNGFFLRFSVWLLLSRVFLLTWNRKRPNFILLLHNLCLLFHARLRLLLHRFLLLLLHHGLLSSLWLLLHHRLLTSLILQLCHGLFTSLILLHHWLFTSLILLLHHWLITGLKVLLHHGLLTHCRYVIFPHSYGLLVTHDRSLLETVCLLSWLIVHPRAKLLRLLLIVICVKLLLLYVGIQVHVSLLHSTS